MNCNIAGLIHNTCWHYNHIIIALPSCDPRSGPDPVLDKRRSVESCQREKGVTSWPTGIMSAYWSQGLAKSSFILIHLFVLSLYLVSRPLFLSGSLSYLLSLSYGLPDSPSASQSNICLCKWLQSRANSAALGFFCQCLLSKAVVEPLSLQWKYKSNRNWMGSITGLLYCFVSAINWSSESFKLKYRKAFGLWWLSYLSYE